MPSIEESESFAEFCELGSLNRSSFVFVDAPDFVRMDGSLGVELVAYHRDTELGLPFGSLRRIQESQIAKLLASAKTIYFASNRPSVDVCVFPSFRQERPPRDAAEQLVGFVVDSTLGRTPPLPPALRGIAEEVQVSPTPPCSECVWQAVRADFVDVHVPAIRSHVEAKEELVPAYRTKAQELWLVVYGMPMPSVGLSETGRWSGHGRVTDALRQTPLPTSFDRVFYLDRHSHTCTELKRGPSPALVISAV